MKRILKYLFLLQISSISLGLYAQYKGFDLSRYKLPDIKISRLDANINLNSFANKNDYKPTTPDSSLMKSNSFQGEMNLNFYHFRNTEKYQGDLEISLYGNLSPYDHKDDKVYFSLTSQNENLSISSNNRFYNGKLNFIEVDPTFYANKSVQKSVQEYAGIGSVKICNDQYLTNISIPVSAGHGRIEPVEDLRLAIYILEELNKSGRIDSLPSDEVVLDMAKQISAIKRKRFFDTRLRKIRELQVIDSFLIANRIVKPADITYFAVLNDQWDYASGPARSAGFAVNGGLDDHFNSAYSTYATSYDGAEPIKNIYTVNTWEIGGFFQARYYKPVSLYWQTSLIFLTSYGREFTRDPRDGDNPLKNFETNIFRSSLSGSMEYFPNSRTSVSLSLSGNFLNSRGDRTILLPLPTVYAMNENRFLVNAGLNMYYYISPRFRLRLNSNLSYNTRSPLNSKDTNPGFKYRTDILYHDYSLTLIYSFF